MKKKFISFLFFCLFGSVLFAQNPTVINPTNGAAVFPATRKTGNVFIGLSTNDQAAGKVFTATGAFTAGWALPAGGGGGDVFTMSNNTFTVASTNTFNGFVTFTNLTTVTSPGDTKLLIDTTDATGQTRVQLLRLGVAKWEYGNDLNSNGISDFYLYDYANAIVRFRIDPATGISYFNAGGLSVTNDFWVSDNTTLGNATADAITFNASTLAIPNTLNIGSGVLVLTPTVTTNGVNAIFDRNATFTSNTVYEIVSIAPGPGALSTNTIPILGSGMPFIGLTNDTFFTASSFPAIINRGVSVSVNITNDGVANRTLTFDSDWRPINNFSSVLISNKGGWLSIMSTSTNNAGVWYTFSQQP